MYMNSPELHLLDLVIRSVYGTSGSRLWLFLVIKVLLHVLWDQLISALSAYGSVLLYFHTALVGPCIDGYLRFIEIPSFEKGVIYAELFYLGFFLFGQGVVAFQEFFGQELFFEGVLTEIGQLRPRVSCVIITGFFGAWTLAHSSGQ